MKLVSSFLCLGGSSVLGFNLDISGHSQKWNWDALGSTMMDRSIAIDGGNCVSGTREDAYSALQNYFLDFRGANRVPLNSESVTVSTEESKSFWWHANKFTKVTVDGYGTGIRLWNPNLHPENPRSHYMYGLKRPYQGGAFYVHKTMDRSALKWFYGQGQKSKGFVPHTGLVFTYIYMDAAGENCNDGLGDNFQIVLMVDLKQRSRAVFNYGPLRNVNAGNVRAGFKHFEGSDLITTSWFITGATNLQTEYENVSVRYKNWNKLIEKSPIFADPETPRTCSNTKHCNCHDILSDDVGNMFFEDPSTGDSINRNNFANNDDWRAAVTAHYAFGGRCSFDADTLNYGDYAERGHLCFVKPASADCEDEGGIFVNEVFAGQPDEQFLPVYSFACVVGTENGAPPPYWQRVKTRMEKKLKREVYMSSSTRKQAKKRWNQKQNRSFGGMTKWQRRQQAKNGGPMADRVLAAPEKNHNLFCGFYCEHPSIWSAETVKIAGYPEADFARNGNWVCNDADGNAVGDGDGVPYGGWCELRCDAGTVDAATNRLQCWRWYRPVGHLQYVTLHTLYNELTGLEPEGDEWQCDA